MNTHTFSSSDFKTARLSRDPRFDGLFFIAVKTTGIFCRPICPAQLPKEENVCYFKTAIEAAREGFRPCLRCRPDSAPGSNPWQGVETSFNRAVKLIDEGFLTEHSIDKLSDKLGITDRYLRKLFHRYLGVSPIHYAQYQQCMFAKQLLHQSRLPISDIAIASGFNSVRRFNDCFKKMLKVRPSDIRKSTKSKTKLEDNRIHLTLSYRPPYDWEGLLSFLSTRQINHLEWFHDSEFNREGYGRTFFLGDIHGDFFVSPVKDKSKLDIAIQLEDPSKLNGAVKLIQRILDLNSNASAIDQQLSPLFPKGSYKTGIKIPQTASFFEAGIRAILGQQVSVKAAQNLVTRLVTELGQDYQENKKLFPTAMQIKSSSLDFLKMPQARRETLKSFADWYVKSDDRKVENLLSIKGIGPWTVDYIRMRGLADTDVWLGSDLGIKNALKNHNIILNAEAAKPWRSYLTFQVWSML
ncbi:Ada metal-binding domain-containing protein [Pleionea sediminis]|uniref:Ada metal-binding domain-containing protein n=1 Tax=Pleionea sediminis TaxID=2569479 RepID=UPI001185EB79|nr:Ada metal-binding domain-containing protein [Pleionea sediminis]